MFLFFKGINVLEQEKLDNTMIEMDGTENKCKPGSHRVCSDAIFCVCLDVFPHQCSLTAPMWCVFSQLSLGPMLFSAYPWPYAKLAQQRKVFPCTATLLIWLETESWSSQFP